MKEITDAQLSVSNDTFRLASAIREYRKAQFPRFRDASGKLATKVLVFKLSRAELLDISQRVLGRIHETIDNFVDGDDIAAFVDKIGRVTLQVFKTRVAFA